MENEQITIYSNQIEFCYGNVEWTHKIHEKAADFYTSLSNWISLFQLILSFIIGWDVLSQMRAESPFISWFLVLCSALLALLNSITKVFDFEKCKSRHIATAKSLWELREDYRSFKNDIKAGLYEVDSFLLKRQELQKRAEEIYKQAPRTFDRAYNRAKKDFDDNKVSFEHLEEK